MWEVPACCAREVGGAFSAPKNRMKFYGGTSDEPLPPDDDVAM
jgi:hypothetical protein